MSKYSPELAAETLEWIRTITGENINTSGDTSNFWETLKDGTLLCQLVNELQAGSVKKIQTSKMAFKCMENINSFLSASKALGVSSEELFQTVDLWEQQNLHMVVLCLQALGRKASNFGKAGLGPRESEKNQRQFTDEQMNAGKGLIGLQMGSNKGATQSGINMGNTRHM